MTIFQALVLGIIQGLTEFLPISSSGHLVVLPELFGWEEQPLVFDTTMHLATAAALIAFFWKDLVKIVSSFVKDFVSYKLNIEKFSTEAKLGMYLLAGIVPAGILGYLFEDFFETLFRGVLSVAVFLILGSILMWFADRKVSGQTNVSLGKAVGIGFFQSLALFPGVSRSGSTISGGLILGLGREAAARFSFLLSIPIVLAAGLFQLVKSEGFLSDGSILPLIVGFLASFISGLWAIRFLLGFVKTHSLKPFILYRLVLGLGLLALVFFK